jgi:hypothetical protein
MAEMHTHTHTPLKPKAIRSQTVEYLLWQGRHCGRHCRTKDEDKQLAMYITVEKELVSIPSCSMNAQYKERALGGQRK